MEEDLTFDTIPAKFCGMVEQYRIELAKKSWIELQLDVSLDWCTICWIHETVLISKKFWFIQRLVKENKIDNSKFYDKNILKWFMTLTKEEKADSIIMNLSISEIPISDLISYLK